MKRLWVSINVLHIITIVMICLILAALIAGHFSASAKGKGTTHACGSTANAQGSR